jgi:hypothetical protein
LLRPAATDYLPGQQIPPPELVIIEDEPEYYVKSVEDLRYNKQQKRHKY